MTFCYKDDTIDWRIVLLTCILCAIHILGIYVIFIGCIVAYVEAFALLLVAVKRRMDIYLYLLVIFWATSFEFTAFIDKPLDFAPSVSQLPIVQGYFFLLLSLWPIPRLLKNKEAWLNISKKKSLLSLLLFSLISLTVGIIMGVVSILIDEVPYIFHIVFFFREIISVGIVLLYAIYFLFALEYYKSFLRKMSVLLFSTLSGIILIAFVGALMGLRGIYDTDKIILMPLSFFYSTSIIFFLGYRTYRSKHTFLLLFLSSLALFMQFVYSNALGGKSWLVIFFILFTFSVLWIRKNIKNILIILLVIPVLCSLFNIFFIKQESNDSLSSGKLIQAMAVLSLVDFDMYDALPHSPKVRVEEVINTSIEYSKHPFFLFFGKGFGGGHRDYRNAYGYFDESAFSLDEYNSGYFIKLHESINILLLKFGLLGLLLFSYVLFFAWRGFIFSPWLILGVLWITLFLGYSNSLMSIGLPSLVIGLGTLRHDNKKVR